MGRGEKSRWRAARPRESNLVETIAISNSRFFGIFTGILRVTECVYSASSGLCQRIPRTAWTRVGAAFGRKGPSARRRGALSFRVGPTFFFLSLSFSPLFHSTRPFVALMASASALPPVRSLLSSFLSVTLVEILSPVASQGCIFVGIELAGGSSDPDATHVCNHGIHPRKRFRIV